MHSRRTRHSRLAPLGLLIPLILSHAAMVDSAADPIQLHLMPRVCTLSANDKQCQTRVQAQWQSTQNESLCLVILDRPDIKRCWENFRDGSYTLQLTFNDDLTFQLRDPQLQEVFASEVLRVIREAVHYRHRRREPWNIFN